MTPRPCSTSSEAASAASLEARRAVDHPEEARTQAFALAAEAAELILCARADDQSLRSGIHAAAALAYEAASRAGQPPADPWPGEFADEDEEAAAWMARYRAFQRGEWLLGPYRNERARQADLLRDMVGNPFECLDHPA